MKFSHEFQAALLREGFPEHWVNSAIPYRPLKKIIKKVEEELRSLGLDSKTLSQLVAASKSGEDIHQRQGSAEQVAFQYHFAGREESPL